MHINSRALVSVSPAFQKFQNKLPKTRNGMEGGKTLEGIGEGVDTQILGSRFRKRPPLEQ
jgi:hypothetical protein